MSTRPVIAIDGDGVLLNYNRTFGALWEAHFGVELEAVEPRAYHAVNFWGVEAPEKGHAFWDIFDAHGWSSMPPMPGALEACERLHAAGYELVCVTSMPEHRAEHRLQNLQSLGFPIDRVIATNRAPVRGANPKKEALEALLPSWFVDDELRKLKDLPAEISLVLVDPGHPDTPNPAELPRDHLSMEVHSLEEFAEKLLGSYYPSKVD